MIYLDHNATNPPDPRLLEVYLQAMRDGWANPSSLHTPGRRARALVEEAREEVAALAGVAPGQVTFCASGTEALNQALRSALPPTSTPGERATILASAVEHPAVLEPLEDLEARGRIALRRLPVDPRARLDLGALDAALSAHPTPALVAVLAAQNEIGTVQPLDAVGARCAAAGAPLLVDAVQAVGRLERDWSQVPWDYLVLSGHKLRAPRGAAALVHRGRAPEPRPVLLGGGQERGRRAGTEPVAAIAALGAACRLAREGSLLDPAALRERRDRFEADLLARVPGLEVIAQDAERLPQTTYALVPGDSEALLAGLDLAGISASSGSACASGALKPSHVLAAMGVPPERARGRLRFSFGPETSDEDLVRAVDALAGLVG